LGGPHRSRNKTLERIATQAATPRRNVGWRDPAALTKELHAVQRVRAPRMQRSWLKYKIISIVLCSIMT
jgi:hypothetical protein